MKKGFTLIELLAVIIILAVIALIATPVILNVVDETREKARIQSVAGYADAVKLSYTEEMMNNTGKSLKELADSKMQGEKVVCEYVKFKNEYGALLHTCEVNNKGNYCYANGRVYDNDTEECSNIYSIIFSAEIPYSAPVITTSNQTPSDTEYAQSKEIKIEYPSLKVVEEHYFIKVSESVEINNVVSICGTGEYPIDCVSASVSMTEANTWYEVSGEVVFIATSNISIESIIGNNNEYGSKATYLVENIDTEVPMISASVSGKIATFTLGDNIGVIGYGVSNSADVEPEYTTVDKITNTTVTYTATEPGIHYAWVKDASGRTAKVEFTIDESEFSYAATVSCDDGYTLSGNVCSKRYQSGTSYSCPNGGTLSGTTCTISSSYDATCSQYRCTLYKKCNVCSGGIEAGNYSDLAACNSDCSGGCALVNGSVTCCSGGSWTGEKRQSACGSETVYGSECDNANSKVCNSYTCPNGGTLSGSTCTTSSSYGATGTPQYSTDTKTPNYSCPNGGTLSGTTCVF